MAFVAGQVYRTAARQVGRAGGSIHSARCGASNAGASQLRDWDNSRKDDTGCDCKGIGPLLWVFACGRKLGRLSLVWDCVEPLRPELVRTVFGYAKGRT